MSNGKSGPVGLGVVGCGVISDIYLQNCTTRFESVKVVGVADLMKERADAQAAKYGVESFTVDELLAHPDVELVLNITVPAAHAEVALAAVSNGKSVYNEKPLTVSAEDGRKLLDLANEKGVRVGAAPDTFLGGGLQTVRSLLDAGTIGAPVAAAIAFYSHGMETWHRDPYFYYQPGGGPLFDMGPYYLTALAGLLGPIRRVSASARASFPERTITSEPKKGQTIPVNTPTHIIATLDYEGGTLASLTTTFDVWETNHATLVLYGSEGTIALPDPNTFGGPVRLLQPGGTEWEEQPLTHGNTENSRGIGVADMASALREGTPHRASGEMAFHVLEAMHACLESSMEGRHVELTSRFERPAAL